VAIRRAEDLDRRYEADPACKEDASRVQPRSRRYAAVAAPFGRDLARCFDTIELMLGESRERGAELVAFPECALGGPPGDDGDGGAPMPPALAPDGPELRRLAELAGDTVVCAGFTERTPSGCFSTTACVHGGRVLGLHRKVHIPPSELRAYCAGERFGAIDTPAGRIGLLTCYDKVFPEAARALALDGAEILVALSAWPACRHRPAARLGDDVQSHHFDLLDQARAVENQVVVVSSNLSGRFGLLRYLGQAKVVDADGRILDRTGPGLAAVAAAELGAEQLAPLTTRAISHLRDRRPPAYGPLLSSGLATV
jgi:predicted amidohydrolase